MISPNLKMTMMTNRFVCRLVSLLLVASLIAALAGAAPLKGKKVLMITDVEGVVGVFNFDLQCVPFKGALYPESRKLLAGEVNSAVKGLVKGGATDVVVYDNHYGGHNLSALDIEPEPQLQSHLVLLGGSPVSPTLGLDKSYSAIMFIGLHAMAGTPHAILPHSFTWDVKNIWVNGKKVGEIGARVMLAGELGIPAIMVSGDRAACEEYRALVPNGNCAVVKWASGESSTGGYSLTSADADQLIGQQAEMAMQHLAQFKPYPVSGPAVIKVQFNAPALTRYQSGPGVERLSDDTWQFSGSDFVSAWLKFRSF